MAILGNKKVAIPDRSGASIPDPSSRKEGVPFHNLFNFSRVRTPGKSITGVLEKPVLKDSRPLAPKADLEVVKSWVALEEKIVHDHKAGPVQKIQEQKKAAIRPIVLTPAPSKQDAVKRSFFDFSKTKVSNNDASKVLNPPVVSGPQIKVSRPSLKEVQSWVAMEEKIIPASKTSGDPMSDGKKVQKIRIVGPQAKRVMGLETSKEKATFVGLFSFLRAQTPSVKPLNAPNESKEPVVKGSPLDLSKVNVAAVKDWVTSEEAVLHAHQEQKTSLPKDADLSSRVSPRRVPTMPESLKTQTTVPLSRGTLIAPEPVRDHRKAAPGVGRFLWVLGWLVGGAFVFFYAQAVFISHQNEQKSLRLESEKSQLEQAYVALKGASDDQAAEMIWLRSQIQDMTWELKEAKSEMVALRNTVRTKDEIVQALKAQTQALENILSQARAAVLPKASEAPRERFSVVDPSVVRGVVSSINDQQGFIVVNVGSSQGVHSGQWIMIARSDKKLAVGRIDRVYPTMAVAKLRDKKMFQMIQEGDSVFFS